MASTTIPQLAKTDTSKQLTVNGKPFLMLSAELNNSSMTSSEYMDTVWKDLAESNINTVLGAVTWEMVEPVEGQFDFTELDKAILGARNHGLHLVLLWLGTYKNGLSTYVPEWIKTDPTRFPRVKLRKPGGVLETADILTMFNPNALKADTKAYEKFMAHVKEVDEAHSTVLMVQIQNEVGILGDSRDCCDAANQRFSEPVPGDLIKFLAEDWDSLHEDLKANLHHFKQHGASATNSDWKTVFGQGPRTDEIFMAYHYALYLQEIATKGQAIYPIPCYANVWQENPSDGSADDMSNAAGGGGGPGEYPSGGGTSNVLDIWQEFAPALDFIAPDLYMVDYTLSCAKYRHRNQALFIPEQRRDEWGARRVWIAYGSFAALGASPFGIDTQDPATNPYTRHYGLIKSVAPLILEAQRTGTSIGVCFDELNDDGTDPSKPIVHHFGDFELTIERSFVFGRPGPGAGMVIHRGGGNFLLLGWGFQVKARSTHPKAHFTGILRFDEKVVVDEEKGTLKTARRLNGDESKSGSLAIMPNEDPDYDGFPIAVTIPARTMIAEVVFYDLKE